MFCSFCCNGLWQFGRLPFCTNIHIGFECRGFLFSFFFWVCVLARVLVLEEWYLRMGGVGWFFFFLLVGRWSLIAAKMPGRTDNDIKNHWNTRLKKKLCDMGIDPVTHKPIAELLKDLAGTMAQSSGCNEVGTYHYCTLRSHHLTIRGYFLEQQSCKILCTYVHLSFYLQA